MIFEKKTTISKVVGTISADDLIQLCVKAGYKGEFQFSVGGEKIKNNNPINVEIIVKEENV